MFQAFNILRYNIGQKYNSHYDAFNVAEYGPQKSQRVLSISTENIEFYLAIMHYCYRLFVTICLHAHPYKHIKDISIGKT